MRKFDTKVQHLKYKVLREVARLAWNDKLLDTQTAVIVLDGKTKHAVIVLKRVNRWQISARKQSVDGRNAMPDVV